MISKIRELLGKYWGILSYLFFGALTTVVNYLVYFPLYNWLQLSATVSNAIAWIFAVAFAYLTNKPFVFKSHDWSAKTLLPELAKFVGFRVGSGVAETLLLLVCVDWLMWNGNLMKIATSVFVVVINYVASKLFVFRKKGEG